MSESPAIHGIRRAALKRAQADDLKREAIRELRNYCLLAKAEGVSITRIAQEAGLSRQGVYDLLAARQLS
jgi:AcrR family transcriptional regulator